MEIKNLIEANGVIYREGDMVDVNTKDGVIVSGKLTKIQVSYPDILQLTIDKSEPFNSKVWCLEKNKITGISKQVEEKPYSPEIDLDIEVYLFGQVFKISVSTNHTLEEVLEDFDMQDRLVLEYFDERMKVQSVKQSL